MSDVDLLAALQASMKGMDRIVVWGDSDGEPFLVWESPLDTTERLRREGLL